MMPVHPGTWLAYAFAILSGFAFGYVLENAGFGSSRKLAAQFYLRDMTVLKVMFSAIVTAMLGLTLLRAVGVLDFDALYVNPTFLGPQIVGGVIFGIGFAVGGYCPGTAVVATVTGKLDALAFLVGIGGGVLAFAGSYDRVGAFAKSGSGERMLLPDVFHLSYGVVAILVVLMALGMFAGAEYIEKWMARTRPLKAEEAPKEADPTSDPHPGGTIEPAHGTAS